MGTLKDWLVYLFLPWLHIHWQNQKLGQATDSVEGAAAYMNHSLNKRQQEIREMATLFVSVIIACDNNIFIPYEVAAFANTMDNLDVITIQEPDGLRLKVNYLTPNMTQRGESK